MDEFRLYMAGNALATVLSFCGCILYSSFGCVQFTFTFQMRAYLRVLRNHLENDGAKDSSIYQRHKLYIQYVCLYNK
ncbi:hypothetical protein O3M35_009767 [Rhynocoris fuscipes]|uniref:Uncharacterized protein n=1 Tax=Rhynocoris fuscipes TaxID=488301 RepID=A0AAW1D475_9HEMI